MGATVRYYSGNRVNFGPPVGIRNASNFMQAIVTNAARSMQLGVRVTF